MQREPYLRWHPAIPDSGSMRGANLESLNARTMEVIQEIATQEWLSISFKGPGVHIRLENVSI